VVADAEVPVLGLCHAMLVRVFYSHAIGWNKKEFDSLK